MPNTNAEMFSHCLSERKAAAHTHTKQNSNGNLWRNISIRMQPLAGFLLISINITQVVGPLEIYESTSMDAHQFCDIVQQMRNN